MPLRSTPPYVVELAVSCCLEMESYFGWAAVELRLTLSPVVGFHSVHFDSVYNWCTSSCFWHKRSLCSARCHYTGRTAAWLASPSNSSLVRLGTPCTLNCLECNVYNYNIYSRKVLFSVRCNCTVPRPINHAVVLTHAANATLDGQGICDPG